MPTKKGEKERKDKEKEKKNDKMTEKEQCFINLEKNAGNREHIIFLPLILIVTLKRAQKSPWGKIYDIIPPVSLFFPP